MSLSRTPRWEELYGTLRAQIESGELAPGDLLLGERELCRSSGMSRTTVRHALRALADAGLITAEPQKGWRVVVR